MSEKILLSPSTTEKGLATTRYFDSPLGFGEIKADHKDKIFWFSTESGLHGWINIPDGETQTYITEDSLLKGLIRREMVFQQTRAITSL
jgi:hypothetical protein